MFGNSFPIIPGHEIIGDVVAVPDSEKTWKVGDRVGGPWHGGHDGTCKACQRGLFQMCKNETINGVMVSQLSPVLRRTPCPSSPSLINAGR